MSRRRQSLLNLLCLEDRSTPSSTQIVAVGADAGGMPEVTVYRNDGTLLASFLAFDPSFRGGVRVATGDVNGDGFDDLILGTGPGSSPLVQVLDGASLQGSGQARLLAQVVPFESAFAGGVFVAAGDVVPGDNGRAEVIVGAGQGGGPHVRTFGFVGTTVGQLVQDTGPLGSFFAYTPTFTGGVRVAAGNLDGPAALGDDLITGAGPGGGPHVQAFQPSGNLLASFYAYAPTFTGGVYVAAGDMDGAGVPTAELITGAGAGGGPHVRVFSLIGGITELNSFFAFDPAFAGGVRVGAGFRTTATPSFPVITGHPELLTGAGPGGGPAVQAFDVTPTPNPFTGLPQPSVVLTFSAFAFDPAFTGGVFVSV